MGRKEEKPKCSNSGRSCVDYLQIEPRVTNHRDFHKRHAQCSLQEHDFVTIWDDKHGFGFNKDGEVVIVTPNTLPTHSVFNSENFKQMCE